jgi:hypothetical protein
MLACCSPKIDLLAIVDLVALGENQVLIAASPLSLIGVTAAGVIPTSRTVLWRPFSSGLDLHSQTLLFYG